MPEDLLLDFFNNAPIVVASAVFRVIKPLRVAINVRLLLKDGESLKCIMIKIVNLLRQFGMMKGYFLQRYKDST